MKKEEKITLEEYIICLLIIIIFLILFISCIVDIFYNGENLDVKRTVVAQQELVTVNEIATANQNKENFNPETSDVAVTEIKQELAKYEGAAPGENVRNIVNNTLEDNGLTNVVQKSKLISW